jgi:hypothetical protein
MRKFFTEADKHQWQVDFWDCFAYGHNVNEIIELILGVQNQMDKMGLAIPLIFNSISSCGYFAEREPNGEELDAHYRLELEKAIRKKTRVAFANYDAIEDYSNPENSRYCPCGMVEYGTLRKRPSWDVAKKIERWDRNEEDK